MVIPAILQKLGIMHSKYPTALLYGPTLYAGLDLVDLRTESSIFLLKALHDSDDAHLHQD
jgi:hypothetical protein